MQHNNTRDTDTSVKKLAECFATIGWNTKLCELKKEQVLAIISTISANKGYENEYTEEGKLEHQQILSDIDKFDDKIPF